MMTIAAHLRIVAIWTALALVIPTGASAQKELFRQYGSADGLTNLNVKCLLQDHIGYLWVGTDNGLFRYDGGGFRAFDHDQGLLNTEILGLAESPTGVLWVATQGGVERLAGTVFKPVDVGEQGAFRTVSFDHRGQVFLENPSGIVRGIPDGVGSYRFHTVVAGAVRGMYVNGDEVFFGRDGDLWRLTGDRAERIGAQAALPVDRWDVVVQDTLGNLWVRSATRLYELPRGQTRFVDRSDGVPHAPDPHLYADRHGRLFVSSIAGTVVLDGLHRTIIDSRHGLPAESAEPTLIDREESLWMGTDGGGLVRRLGHGEWLSWTKSDGLLHNTVWTIRRDRAGQLWVGTNGGLSILKPDGGVVRAWTSHNGLAGDRVLSIAEGPKGDFFVGTDPAGISHFDSRGVLLRTYRAASGYTADQVSTMAIDHQNRLWAMGTGGCFRSRAPLDSSAALQFDPIDLPGIPARTSFRNVLVDDDSIVWIASSAGLLRFDGAHWKVFTERDGLKSADLASIAQGQGDLWLSYRDALGMARLRFRGEQVELTHYTMQDGLSSNEVYAFAFDLTGKLWANTDKGVSVLEQGRWHHFDSQNGLIWDDTDSLASYVDAEGNVWIGTSGGMSRYTPSPYPIPNDPPPVVLTSIEGVSHEWQTTDHPILPYAQRSLNIRYAGLSYESETRLRFRYRLKGYDDTWNETSERSVRFAALPAGNYVFEVIAVGTNGLASPVPARFVFSINPPWWQSWWFVTSCVFLSTLFGYALWHLRVRALIAQKELLEQQVADRTAELVLSHRQLEEFAYFDVLTSLPNRRMFAEEFRKRLSLARRRGEPFALLLIDLDFFKQINDTFGHDAGDAVLVETACRLRIAVRETDCVARLGGDEFAILLFTAHDSAAIEAVCRRILDSFSVGIRFKDISLRSGCSVGIALFPDHGETQESLYKSADLALYEAKRTSRNVFRWHRPEPQK